MLVFQLDEAAPISSAAYGKWQLHVMATTAIDTAATAKAYYEVIIEGVNYA